jgi:hypothetical protein
MGPNSANFQDDYASLMKNGVFFVFYDLFFLNPAAGIDQPL